MDKTISVVVPLFNGERFIKKALTSVLNQTRAPDEIIVVDDGSTDNGPALVAALAETHPITLLTKPNGGQSSARNLGIARATGDLIALLDQDDIWYLQHLEELAKPFTTSIGRKVGWVYSDVDEINLDGSMVTQFFMRTRPGLHPKRDIAECLRSNMYVVPSATLILHEAFDAVGGFDERLTGYEDDDLFVRIFRAGYGNEFLNIVLTQWRIHGESSTFTGRSMRKSRAIFFRKWWDTYPDDPQRDKSIRRDVLLPRFYIDAVGEYIKAVRHGDAAEIAETREELLYIVSRMGWKRKIFGHALTRMRSPQIIDTALSLHRHLRPVRRLFI